MNKKYIIEHFRPELAPFEEVYRDLHRNPELSLQEVRTAGIVAKHLESLGAYRVITGIGGHGVVGVLENGPGATVLLRADMDALPHLETTGLEYASTRIAKDSDGKETPVMHACGHGMHTSVLMAVAQMMLTAKAKRKGTLVCLFQPAEEIAVGARAMVADGLYDEKKFGIPKPDIVLGQHTHAFKACMVALGGGRILTAVDSYDVRIFGKSGHICHPDLCVDQVVAASHIVVRLQSIFTKEVRPEEFAVVGCACIHGGSTANIVPDFVDLRISIRSYNPVVHERLVAAVRRVIYSECEASGSLAIREPEIKTVMHAPATVNNIPSANILKESFSEYFGDNLIPADPFGASEDFSHLALGRDAPYVFYNFGCVDEMLWDEAQAKGTMGDIPHNRSAFFAPKIQPTMTTAVDAFSLAALTFFEKGCLDSQVKILALRGPSCVSRDVLNHDVQFVKKMPGDRSNYIPRYRSKSRVFLFSLNRSTSPCFPS